MQQEIYRDNYMAEISTKPGKNLKRIRTVKKLPQGTIAQRLEVHRAYIILAGLGTGKEIPHLRQFKN